MAGLLDVLNGFTQSGAGQRSLYSLGSSLLANSSGRGGLGGGAPTTAQAFGQAIPGAIDAYDQYGQQQRRQKIQDLQIQQLEGAVGDAEAQRARAQQLRDAITGTPTSVQGNPFSDGSPGQVQSYLQPGTDPIMDLTASQRAAVGALGDDQLASLVADRSGLNRNVRQLTGEEAEALGFPAGSSLQLNETTGAISPLREGFDEQAYRTKQGINFGYQDRLAANAAARRASAAQSQAANDPALALLQSLGASPEQIAGYQLGSSDYRDEVLGSLTGQGQQAPASTPPVADDTQLGDAFGLINNAQGTIGGLLDYASNGSFGGSIGSEQRGAEAVVNSLNTDLREAMQPVGSRAAVWDRQQADKLLPQPGSTGSSTARKRYQQIAETYLPRQIQSLQAALASGELGTSDTGKARQRLIQAQALQQQLGQYLGQWDGAATPAASGPAQGAVEDGYQFLGGDPADERNWRRADSQPLTIDINGGQ